jgi:hypothetical protein
VLAVVTVVVPVPAPVAVVVVVVVVVVPAILLVDGIGRSVDRIGDGRPGGERPRPSAIPDRAKLSTMSVTARSPPAAKPWRPSRKPTLVAPPAKSTPTVSGTFAAVQVCPRSRVERIRAVVFVPPVASQALRLPCVAAQVPLAAKPASPGSAGGNRSPMSCQVLPSRVRITGKRPLIESAMVMALFGPQKAKQS